MKELELDCAGEHLVLLPEKAIFWPAARTLIVADLHLGKPASFRRAGIAVPENTTAEDLLRLERVLQSTGTRRVVVLGDLLHARAGMQDVMTAAVQQWRARHAALEFILVPGNHDCASGLAPAAWDFQCVERQWPLGPFLLSHWPMESPSAYVIAGHLHPAIVLREKFGRGVRAPCFWFGKRCAVLPAFGSFTGMSDIVPARSDRVFAIGADEIVGLK